MTAEELNKKTLESKQAMDEEFQRVTSQQNGSYAKDLIAFFVGGPLHGKFVNHEELMKMEHKGYTPRWSAMKNHNKLLINLKLEDQPVIDGYLSPMLDAGMLRYETQEVYDCMFN